MIVKLVIDGDFLRFQEDLEWKCNSRDASKFKSSGQAVRINTTSRYV